MKCPKCGSEIEDGDRYCKRCGKRLGFLKTNNAALTGEEILTESGATAGAAPEADDIAKGKVLKHALTAVFFVYVALMFLLFTLPVDSLAGISVYRSAAAGRYGEGLDGNWDGGFFIVMLLVNMFSDFDLVITPCAFMIFAAALGACFAFAWLIVLLCRGKGKRTALKAEIALLAFYAVFTVADTVLIYGVKRVYNSFVGAAPIFILVVTVLCFAGTLAVYVLRKKYFKSRNDLVTVLNITDF